jgi:mono/diheme cytochrome c family protein
LKDENDGITADLPAVPPEKDSPLPAEQVRPTLTWAGEKLKPEWTADLLAGKLAYKPRPYLRARMPAFPRRSLLLAQGLAAEHGCPPKSPPDPPVEEKRAEIGRMLSAKNKWGCVGCHQVGKAAAVGVFEAPGVNFAYGKERLRREFFDRWLWAPLRVEPGTKMPTMYFWGRPSQLADVLGGDSAKQIDALWQYLQQGSKMKPPGE